MLGVWEYFWEHWVGEVGEVFPPLFAADCETYTVPPDSRLAVVSDSGFVIGAEGLTFNMAPDMSAFVVRLDSPMVIQADSTTFDSVGC